MPRRLLRLAGVTAAAVLCPAVALGQAQDPGLVEPPSRTQAVPRPLAVSDLTALEAFGRGGLSPDGRWAVYERRGAYDAAPRFDYEWRSMWALMDLWRLDLGRPEAAPEPLLPGEGPGLQRVAWSPSGRRLLVTRFRDGRLEPGVADVAGRSVRWTGLTLDVPRTGAQAAWAGEDRIVMLVRPDHDLPAALAYQGATPGRLSEAWAQTAAGREPSRTVLDGAGGVAGGPARRPNSALVLWEVGRGAARPLARGGVSDFALSPDGRRLAVLTGDEAAPLRPGTVVQFESPFRQRLTLIDLETGAAASPLPGREVAPGLLRWSPGSRAVLVWARADAASWEEGALVQAGPDGATAMRLDGLDPGGAVALVLGVRADWIGETAVIHARSAGGRADWHAVRADRAPRVLTAGIAAVPDRLAAADGAALRLFADGGAWTVDLAGARRTTPADLALSGVAVSDMELATRLKVNEAPRRSWAAARGADGESWRVGPESARRLGPGQGAVGAALASSATAELYLRRTGLSEALVLRTADGDRTVDAVNAGRADVAFPAGERLGHHDLEGREAESWLFLPPAGTPVRGVLVKVYPDWADNGPWPGPLALTYGLSPQVFAGAGYAVLSPATPQTGPLATRGEDLVRSVGLAVDAALAAHPDLPGDRIAVMGHSFGGYAALEIAARTRRYQAYIVSSGFSDMAGAWGELEPATRILPEDGGMVRAAQGWAETGQAGLPGPPWAAPEAYAAASPYLRADRIRDPVLLLSADMDFVPLSQSERMYSALLRTGGRVRLVTYWGEHHSLWSPANIRDRFSQILAWLALGLEAPAAAGPPDPAAAPSSGPSPQRR